jgi:hypothetical protein
VILSEEMMKKFNMQASTLQRVRALFLILCVATLAACSSIRLAYNHGDTLFMWWMDGYVDLDRQQENWVRKDVDKLFAWHRKTQLSEYAALLTTAQRQLTGTLTQADLLSDYRSARASTELLMTKALPELVELARSMRPEQIGQIEKKFASNNDDYRKKFMRGDAEKRHKARFAKTLEQFEFWFGSFSREQEATLRKASDARPLDNEIWLEERIRRQQGILTMLRKVQQEKLGKEATTVLVQALVKDLFERLESPERKAFYDAYIDSTSKMILLVVGMSTAQQKVHLHKRIQSWIDDLNTLSADKH